jgi:hypothetical protein
MTEISIYFFKLKKYFSIIELKNEEYVCSYTPGKITSVKYYIDLSNVGLIVSYN